MNEENNNHNVSETKVNDNDVDMKRDNNVLLKGQENQTENIENIQNGNDENKDVDMKDNNTTDLSKNGMINHTEIDGKENEKNVDDKSGDNASSGATTEEIKEISDDK